MSDLVERLRQYAINCGGKPEDYLTWQAADEIEKLRGLYNSAEKEVELLSNEHAKIGKELAHVNRLLASVCAENDRLTEAKDANSK